MVSSVVVATTVWVPLSWVGWSDKYGNSGDKLLRPLALSFSIFISSSQLRRPREIPVPRVAI